jgi:hypothetical protein
LAIALEPVQPVCPATPQSVWVVETRSGR